MDKKVYEFISKQTNDPIVEWKTCKISGEPFAIFQSDVEFYDRISPTFDGKKFPIPTPTLSPEERERRKFIFRNERKLYKRKCDATGKDIISMYSPEKPYKVYDQKYRWSDVWDPMEYGRTFDFSQKFGGQFDVLLQSVPLMALININPENSEYCNYANSLKNCYLEVGGVDSQDVYYSHTSLFCADCCDDYLLSNCSHCYEVNISDECSNLLYSSFCQNCHDSSYLIDCQNCNFCFACIGLISKKYHIFNQQYTQQEYQEKLKKIVGSGNIEKVFDDFKKQNIFKHVRITRSESVYGDNIKNSKHAFAVYNVVSDRQNPIGVEHGKYHFITGYGVYDSYDCIQSGLQASLCYEIISGYTSIKNILFCSGTIDGCSNLIYCYQCYASHNCFGCIGLRNKEYCIFNTQYTKEEYEKLVPRIIEHMQTTGERGEFLNPSISPFGYNETTAQEYSPLTRKEALARGYKRMDKEYPINVPEGTTIVKADQIDTLQSDEEILKVAIQCEVSGRPFRIIKPELKFYRKHNLPLPRKHPDVRYAERIQKGSGRNLHLRTCDKCGIEILSIYPQDTTFKVYCEACYNKEIYG